MIKRLLSLYKYTSIGCNTVKQTVAEQKQRLLSFCIAFGDYAAPTFYRTQRKPISYLVSPDGKIN